MKYFFCIFILGLISCQGQKQLSTNAPANINPKVILSSDDLPLGYPSTKNTPRKADPIFVPTTYSKANNTKPTTSQPVTHDYYTIVVGSFKNFDYARSYSESLEKQNLSPFGIKSDNGFYQVCLMELTPLSKAYATLEKFKRYHPVFKNGWIKKLDDDNRN